MDQMHCTSSLPMQDNMSVHVKMKINDHVGTRESAGGFYGEVIFGRGRHDVPFRDPYGNLAVRSEFEEVLYRDHNIVPIGGYQFAFNKLFNIGLDQESTLRVGDLNDEAPQMKIGITRGSYDSTYYNAEAAIGVDEAVGKELNPIAGVNISALNYVFGFMVGDGGSREDNQTVIAPNYKNRNLYHPIPFRMSNDRFAFPNGKYYGKSTSLKSASDAEQITSYYVKKFDDPKPRIIHAWSSDGKNIDDIVDDSVFASTSTVPIISYVEMNLSISEADCRGYFTTNQSSPRVNEFALVSGWYNPRVQTNVNTGTKIPIDDYESLRIFTHFTRPSIFLAEGDTIEAIYRLYAR